MVKILSFFSKYATVICIIAAFFAGYYVNSLQHDKQTLKKERIERKVVDKKRAIGDSNANELEKELKEVKQHEQNIIENAAQNSSQNVGVNLDCNCFDDDFIKLFNQQSKFYERILSSKYDANMPDNFTGN